MMKSSSISTGFGSFLELMVAMYVDFASHLHKLGGGGDTSAHSNNMKVEDEHFKLSLQQTNTFENNNEDTHMSGEVERSTTNNEMDKKSKK